MLGYLSVGREFRKEVYSGLERGERPGSDLLGFMLAGARVLFFKDILVIFRCLYGHYSSKYPNMDKPTSTLCHDL